MTASMHANLWTEPTQHVTISMPLLDSLLSPFNAAKRALWTEPRMPEQRKLTIQLARNTFYFSASVLVIRFLGDAIAI